MEVCSVSKQRASTSLRRQLLGKLRVQRWRGSSGNVRLSRLLMSFLLNIIVITVEATYRYGSYMPSPTQNHRVIHGSL